MDVELSTLETFRKVLPTHRNTYREAAMTYTYHDMVRNARKASTSPSQPVLVAKQLKAVLVSKQLGLKQHDRWNQI